MGRRPCRPFCVVREQMTARIRFTCLSGGTPVLEAAARCARPRRCTKSVPAPLPGMPSQCSVCSVILSLSHPTFTVPAGATEYPVCGFVLKKSRRFEENEVLMEPWNPPEEQLEIFRKSLADGNSRPVRDNCPFLTERGRPAFSGFAFANPGSGRMENVGAGVSLLLISPSF